MRKIIGESHEEAKRLLTAHRKQLDALVEALLARETLNEDEILQVAGFPSAPPLETRVLAANAADGWNGGDLNERAPARES